MATRICLLSLILIRLLFNTPQVRAQDGEPNVSAAFQAQNVKFVELTSGLNQPLFITHAGDGSGRLFIIQRAGQILIFKNGALLPTPFLNIQSIVDSTAGEQGLLSLAFHPNYETNGRFYTIHTDQNKSVVLSMFTRSAANPDLADPNSRVTLLTIPKLYTNHNGGTLAFGPDGYLYWSTGDGGGGGDPNNNAQSLSSLLGKILRLDVNSASPYSIPASNPFYNNSDPSVRKEIWAYGLRNPWRFSFDRLTGDMYIGDVGQAKLEEIDFQPASSLGGENYGWRVMEGSLCFNPVTGCDRSGKVLPVAEYDHALGCSVTGGHVYRGTKYPQMNGTYFYGDFCSGLVYSLGYDSANGWRAVLSADTPYAISSFGEDEQGELYLADYAAGKIYQVVYMLPPGKATLRSPSGVIANTQPAFSWNQVTGNSLNDPATWYYLWINRINSDGTQTVIHNKWYLASQVCGGSTCSVTPAVTLADGSYVWWVQTWNDGGYGPWSDGLSFQTIPPPAGATPVSPSGTISTPSPAYTWNKANTSTWYYLWVNKADGTPAFQPTWYLASQVCGGTTCSVTPSVTLPAGNYTWWVQTWNEGGYGPWSNGKTFTVQTMPPPGAATLISPSGGVTTSMPAFRWNKVSASTWYYLWVNRLNTDGTQTTIHTKWYPAAQVCGSACSVTPSLTLPAGSYIWWVQTWNDGGYGPWSNGKSFAVSP